MWWGCGGIPRKGARGSARLTLPMWRGAGREHREGARASARLTLPMTGGSAQTVAGEQAPVFGGFQKQPPRDR